MQIFQNYNFNRFRIVIILDKNKLIIFEKLQLNRNHIHACPTGAYRISGVNYVIIGRVLYPE